MHHPARAGNAEERIFSFSCFAAHRLLPTPFRRSYMSSVRVFTLGGPIARQTRDRYLVLHCFSDAMFYLSNGIVAEPCPIGCLGSRGGKN